MLPRPNTKLLTLATFAVLCFFVLALWRSTSSSSLSSTWADDDGWSETQEGIPFRRPTFEESSEKEDEGMGGSAAVGESGTEGGKENVELGQGGSISPDSNASSETLYVLPRPPSKYPSRPRLSLDDLSTLRKSYLARLATMETLSIIPNESHNGKMLGGLVRCLEDGEEGKGKCATEVPRVVAVTEAYFHCAVDQCDTTGEVIWLAPVAASLERQGFFSLVVYDIMILPLHKQLGDIITQFWMENQGLIGCLDDRENCVQNRKNPEGIPAWKLFALTFWGSVPGDHLWNAPSGPWTFNPLGSEWTLTPYQMPDDHTFIGFNFEGCFDTPVLPSSERDDTIFLLAKFLEYFYTSTTWPLDLYQAIVNATGVEILTTAEAREGDDTYQLPAGVTSLGRLLKEEYSRTLGSAKVLLGIGMPRISPSPYAAFVPVILPSFGTPSAPNPLFLPTGWDQFTQPSQHQHAVAAHLGPPYVYSVNLNGPNPLQELEDAIREVWKRPIGRYVPPDMTPAALNARIAQHLSIDWESVGTERMKERGWKEVTLAKHLVPSIGKPRFRKEI